MPDIAIAPIAPSQSRRAREEAGLFERYTARATWKPATNS